MKIQLDELQKTITNCQSVSDSLNIELNNIKNKLEEICSNVNSSELIIPNQNITNEIENISSNVQNNMPKIIEFLKDQIKKYQASDGNAKEQINSLVSEIDNNLG